MLTSIAATNMPIALTGGVVYLLMAVTMWHMLRHTPLARVVRLWTSGAVCLGLGLVLIASRDLVHVAIGYGLPGALFGAGLYLQTAALRSQLGLPGPWPVLRWPAALLLGPVLCTLVLDLRAWLFVVVVAALAGMAAMLAWHAHRTAVQERSRSASMIAWSQWALALLMLLRALAVAAGLARHQHNQGGLSFVAVHAAVVLAALYGSLGFMGLMLDLTRRAEVRAREREAAEAGRREVAEQAAQDLRDLLQQRDALSAERERMLQLLAHEIRQPLHNASGALQAAGQALRSQPAAGDGPQVVQVSQRLGRANAVLGEVRAVLDNTLAAATLLSRSAPLALQEIDLDFLIDLALGDLDEAHRQRVQVQWLTDLREAELEPGLLRLALRNLLTNAFSHGGPAVVVRLQVDEQAQPPALLLRVIDDGPGLVPEGATTAGAAPQRPGLGLAIVRQVAALHGGRLDLLPATPQGLQAVLVLPLPAA